MRGGSGQAGGGGSCEDGGGNIAPITQQYLVAAETLWIELARRELT